MRKFHPLGIIFVLAMFWAVPQLYATGEFVQVGVHPDAITQATSTGRMLQTLKAFAGKVYAGYGDYNTNTGPIGIRAFDPATNTFGAQLLSSSTEAIYLFRQIGERLYAPQIDPRLGGGGYALSGPNGVGAWSDQNKVSVTHCYDVATLNGTDRYLVGSLGTGANVWRSTDGGNSYSVLLNNVRPQVDNGSNYSRFYFAGVYQNKLYVQGMDSTGSRHPTSRVFNGSTWTTGPDLLPAGGYGWQPQVFAGKMVYESYTGSSSFYSFDGTAASKLTLPFITLPSGGGGGNNPGGGIGGATGVSCIDFTIDGGWLYLLNSQREIFATDNLSEWHYLSTAPTFLSSLAVLDGTMYLGGSEARLYKYTGPIPEPATLSLLLAGVGFLWQRRRK